MQESRAVYDAAPGSGRARHGEAARIDRNAVVGGARPAARKAGRPRPHRGRQPAVRQRRHCSSTPSCIVAKTGIPWRDLPERFGNWNSVWRRFNRWCRTGVWTRLAEALAEALGEPDLTELHLDSTSVKAHRVKAHRDACRLAPSGRGKKEEADTRRCHGRSRGGFTVKLHVASDARGRPVRLRLKAGGCI